MTHRKPYQWLLFDADGTLFDYDMAEAKALEAAFLDFALPFNPQTAEAYRVINQQVWQDFEKGRITAEVLRTLRFERLFESIQVQTAAPTFSKRYLHHLSHASDLMPGAEEAVRALMGQYRLAVITNGLKDVQRPRLELSPIAGCFEVVAISEELGAAKPDPHFFDAAFAMMRHPARETALVIGDGLTSDIQGGNLYGLDTCWFNPLAKPADPRFPATYEIRQLAELVGLLQS